MTNLSTRFAIPRAPGVTNTHVALGFFARFYDELVSGLPDVLMPTIQALLGLSLTQVALLRQVQEYVGVVVEPVGDLLIDTWRREWLMGFGAAVIGLGIITIGLASTFFWLIVAFILLGLAGGALTHTGDVVVVESYPTAPDRAFARSTLIDTVGALLAPLLVTVFLWQGWSWRWLLVMGGGLGAVYAAVLLFNRLPRARAAQHAEGQSVLATLRQNLGHVLRDRQAIRWLLMLFVFDAMEMTNLLKTIWLAQYVGLSQAQVGLYVVADHAVGVVSLIALDTWRRTMSARRVLQIVTVAVAILYPLWLLTPGVGARFLLMVPLVFFFAMFWPILKANTLASAPGRAGAVSAVRSAFSLIPLPLLFGLLADSVGLTSAMLGVHLVTVAIMGWMVWGRE